MSMVPGPSGQRTQDQGRTRDQGRTKHQVLSTRDLLIASWSGFREVRLGRRFVFDGRHFVGVDPHHQVVDVVVDLLEPVAGAGWNHHDVARLEVVAFTVADVRAVVAWSVELADGQLRCRAPLPVRDVGSEHQRRRAVDDVVDLADLVVFGDGVGRGFVQLPTMHHPDADVRLADLDVAHLLIEEVLGESLLRVRLQLAERDVVSRAHVAGRLRVSRVDLRLRDEPDDGEHRAGTSNQNALHDVLTVRLKTDTTYYFFGQGGPCTFLVTGPTPLKTNRCTRAPVYVSVA